VFLYVPISLVRVRVEVGPRASLGWVGFGVEDGVDGVKVGWDWGLELGLQLESG
jgi:hypothetical protein